jgi:hypothetical protein
MSLQSLAELLESYASCGERDVLPELAEALVETKQGVIPQLAALSAISHLAIAIQRRKAHPAWICLWRLLDLDGNCGAPELLENLERLPECQTILNRCVACLALFAPEEQRTTCVKFLIAFMNDSIRRRRIVGDTPDLCKAIIDLAYEDIQYENLCVLPHTLVMMSELSLANASAEPGDIEICLRYCYAFLDIELAYIVIMRCAEYIGGNLRLIAMQMPALFPKYIRTILNALSTFWALLSTPLAVRKRVAGQRYGFNKHFIPDIAAGLVSMMIAAAEIDGALALEVKTTVWQFLVFIEANTGQRLLAPCLAQRAKGGPDRRQLVKVLMAGVTQSQAGSKEQHRGRDTLLRWYAKYPRVAALVDKHCPELMRDAVDATVIADGLGVVDAGAAAAAAPDSSPIPVGGSVEPVKAQKGRHCQYPDCMVSGTGTEYTWKCARCCTAYYCSRDHQKRHWWTAHKAVCRTVS